MPETSPKLHLLDWDKPLLPQAVRWLASDWDGSGPLDLSHVSVIVPTRQSGRRLREALAAHAARQGQAVFPPEVLVPESLISRGLQREDIASQHDALFAWMEVLLAEQLEDYDEVFPVPPAERSPSWAARLARQFLGLQKDLAENSLRMGDVGRKVGGPFPEAGRWAQLARLEGRYDRVLAERGLRDPQAARIQAAQNPPALPTGISRVVLLAVPDPLPLAMEALSHLAKSITVEVAVFGPIDESATELFDPWGRPRPDAWRERPVEFQSFDQQVRLCADPADQAARLAELVSRYPHPETTVAVGMADPDLGAVLANALAGASVATHDPEGIPLRREPLHELVRNLLDLSRANAFAHVEKLARCPDLLAWQATRGHGLFSAERFLEGLDDLHQRHLPVTLDAALALARARDPRSAARYPDVVPALERINGLVSTLRQRSFPENITAVLTEIFDARQFEASSPEGARIQDAATQWSAALASVAEARRRFPGISDTDAIEHTLNTFAEARRFPDKPAGALDLQGWLELLWEDAPHLVVTGFNDGRVPAAVVDDPFLPETLREPLGMKSNAERFARDHYILQALINSRARGGRRLDLLLGRTNAAGDPLRPSRLLLACPDEALPDRVKALFREVEVPSSAIPWRRAWKLRPGEPIIPEKITVTGFRSYLQCPFRFYLRHVLRMEPVDPFKSELDALDFGILCHGALEAMGRDPEMRTCTDAARLRDFLIGHVETAAHSRHGDPLPLGVIVQLESLRQRLGKAAEIQAEQCAAGWMIEKVEYPIETEIGGLRITGTIDRIDRNEHTGEYRLIDYKTTDKAEGPETKHCKKLPRSAEPGDFPDYRTFQRNGADWIWLDLQLPLYRRIVLEEYGAAACGYFVLPKGIAATGIYPWDGYDNELQEAADRCADGVIASVKAGRFWPPAEDLGPFDDFAPLFHRGVAESIDWPEVENVS